MRPVALALLALVPLAGAGCVSSFTDPLDRDRMLKVTQREYTNLIRWGEIERASELVDAEAREAFLELLPTFERIRITDYDVGKLRYEPDGEVARVTVTYRGYSLRSLTEQSIREEQEWHRVGSRTWRVRPAIDGLAETFGISLR